MRASASMALVFGAIALTAHQGRALEHEFIELPETMHPDVQGVEVAELREQYAAGDEAAAQIVEAVLERAESYEGLTDQWWLERVLPVTPLGMWTTACPFHPERCQDFSDVRWRWSLEEPFRLYCPLCEQEGREYPYYPNPDYPDDGTGCYPTDEVWRRTHSEEWAEEHAGIPWDHWDGKPHGYSMRGYAYFFTGKWHHMAHMRVASTVLPALGEAYQVCANVLPQDDPRAAKAAYFGHTVKAALLTLARAHLGDGYLRDIVGGGEAYGAMLGGFYEAETGPEAFAGYVPYTLEDGITGNEEHPASSSGADIYCDGSQFGDYYAIGWMRGFALVRDSYTDEEAGSGVLRATECLLAAHPDDAERLEAAGGNFEVKFGKLDYHIRPYAMLAHHNLDGRLLDSQFRLGRLLGDKRIIETTLRNYYYYLHDSVYGDGLSWEGSPAYTNVTWNQLGRFFFEAAHGYARDYGPEHPWWDERLSGLNLYRAQELASSVAKQPLSCLPNGHQIAWEDSHAAARPGLSPLQESLRAGATLPEDCWELLEVTGEGGKQTVRLGDPRTFPSALLHNNRKAVFRLPRGANTDVMALDYGWPVGHWHFPPLTLLLFARGQEVLTDLGYLGAMHLLTREWIKCCPSHNACVVRNAEGGHGVTHLLRGDPTGVMLDAGWAQVAEVAEQIPENLAELGEGGVYGRTVAMIACGEEDSYVLDIFRVRGGAWHEWYLHADGEALSVEGVELTEEEPATTLAERWGFRGSGSERAWQYLRELRAGRAEAGWSATWAPLRTWDSGEKRVSEELGFRCTMLAGGPTELVAALGPGQRYTDNRDLNVKLPVLCARRENREAVDEFVAIHETYRERPFIREARRLQAPQGIVAVRVDRGDQVDYLVSRSWASGDQECRLSTPEGELAFSARFAAVTVAAGQVTRALIVGEGRVALGDFSLSAGPGPRGRLVGFDDREDALVVEPETSWPEGEALEGRWGLIRHQHGCSTFTVRDVEAAQGGRVRVNLKYTPHLALNRVMATGLEGDSLLVEPPLCHPWRTASSQPNLLGFRVYRQLEERLEPVGALRGQGGISATDNWGKRLGPGLPTIKVEGDLARVQPGDELAISRLRPGEDAVEMTAWASFQPNSGLRGSR